MKPLRNSLIGLVIACALAACHGHHHRGQVDDATPEVAQLTQDFTCAT